MSAEPHVPTATERAQRLQWLLGSVLELQALITEAEFDLESFMQRVVDLAETLIHAKGAVVELVEGDQMLYRAASPSIRSHLGLRLDRNGSLSGLCVSLAQVLRCDDADTDSRVDRDACRKVGVRSMICVPLLRRGHAIGVLKVMADVPGAFDASDEYLLGLMAGALGSALANQLTLDALKTSETTFRTAMAAASIGMALVHPDGRIREVNAALCELLGRGATELVGADFRLLAHPDDGATGTELDARTLRGEIPGYRVERRLRHGSGRAVWVLQSVSLARNAQGAPAYFVSQLQDITEQREMERVKNEFISMVSHELRTPLTSILGSLGLVLGTHTDELPAKVRTLLDIAKDNAGRLLALTDDILDIDKLASGHMRFDLQPYQLAAITARAVAANEAYAHGLGVTLALDPIGADACIEVDEGRYIQVISNLLSNAAKFSPAGERVRVWMQATPGRLRINVSDRGPGIPEEFRGHLFQRFSQARHATARRAGGTGLGLHLTRELVERMGGTIGFESEVGRGTTFWIEFPRAGH